MKLSKRLAIVASEIPRGKVVYDIGCDHAYLDIFLTLYNANICYACDKRETVLNYARKNIEKFNLTNQITVVCCDGLKGIEVESGVGVICGMGATTILEILENEKIDKLDFLLVIPNNDYAYFRKNVVRKNLKITDEIIIKEKNIDYLLLKLEHGKQRLNNLDICFGPILRKSKELEVLLYFQKLLKEKVEIVQKMPSKYLGKKIKLLKEIWWLKKKVRPLKKENRTR